MNVLMLSDAAQRAVDAPFAETFLAIAGRARTGKTQALRARYARFLEERRGATALLCATPSELATVASEILDAAGRPHRIIDDVEAEALFEGVAGPLFALEWTEFEAGTIDPEVGGLRSPDRFLFAAFKLIRKLRDAAIAPEQFLESSLAGATAFYAKPPNFAHPGLIGATKDQYRDSLDVDPAELQRQYRREVDLAKILGRLYAHWGERVRETGTMTSRDAIVEALHALQERPDIAAAMRERYPAAFVDEAQEGTLGARKLLEAIYGEALHGVTLAGDIDGATSTFRGARPDAMFQNPTLRVELPAEGVEKPSVTCNRYNDEDREARAVADTVAELLEKGTSAAEIAIIFRSVCDVERYEAALLEREIPVSTGGDANIYANRRSLDALALLWNVWDPFRHDWLIRTLRGRRLALSDATVALLCADPPDNQTALFSFDDEPAPTERANRWDPKRDLRLGWNVVRGPVDATLSPLARDRLRQFRALREGWIEAMSALPFVAFVRRVWSEGLAREGAPGSARALAQEALLRQLLARLDASMRAHPHWLLGDLLADAERRAESEFESMEAVDDPRFVRIFSVDSSRGRSFETVIVPDARAGSFPRWYVPDAFLFSPRLGMIPKDNVGDARASRTAKFSYYLFKTKTREAYNDEERRAFTYALSRARNAVFVSASGRATRGTTAPEFLEELRKK